MTSVYLEAEYDTQPDLGRDALERGGVQYVHASRSPSLAGVVSLGGLQSIRRLNMEHHLLDGNRLPTGEQRCTLAALADHARGYGLTRQQQHDVNDVSVSSVRAHDLAWRDYAHGRAGASDGGFPVLFAMEQLGVVAEHDPFYHHYYVEDFIPLTAISAVYTLPADVGRATSILRQAGAPFLADRVRPLIAPRSLKPPQRRHSCPAIPDPNGFGAEQRHGEYEAMLCLINLQ